MKIILIYVSSLDGKLTRWVNGPAWKWSSPEDKEIFNKIRSENNLLIMGSGSYLSMKPEPEKERLRVVLTKNPERYSKFEVSGQLEFVNTSPKDIVLSLEKRGYKQALFLGGGKLTMSFLKEKLIDELWFTLEPRIFGLGNSFVKAEKMDIHLRLIDSQKLGGQGTLFLRYKVLKKHYLFQKTV